ncbi:sulfotransferase [Streptomyces sp. 4N509B]|uniref:sulfotransferase n=1 Tax=Streptomyces sp. 4N509B TaxID=3457413 RepID=UPI003FD00CE8
MSSLPSPLTFVVGTGRSGSSALSRILNLHPDALSLNELLATLVGPARALPEEPMSGEEFWRILAEPSPVFDNMIRSGAALPEFLDPRPGVPALHLMVLPHLTDDPDALFAELAEIVPGWPRRPAPDHHRAFFELLRVRLGRAAVIERSGYSVGWVPALRDAFPEARFVHLHRTGPDCALSMSRHVGYRFIVQLHEIFELSGVTSIEEVTEEHVAALPPHLAGLLGERFDPALVWDRDIPLTRFGELWSQLVTECARLLAELPGERWTTLGYEALLDDPDAALTHLADFTGLAPTRDWLAAARPLLTASRRDTAARTLPPVVYAALEESCAPGTAVLAGQAPESE